MCVDYRALNDRSITDAYNLPIIEEVFDILKGSIYFSTIDMKAVYHQVEIEDTHKERTAFTVVYIVTDGLNSFTSHPVPGRMCDYNECVLLSKEYYCKNPFSSCSKTRMIVDFAILL